MEPEIERGIQRKRRGEIDRERERKKKKTNEENENEREREREKKRKRERERRIHIVREKNSQKIGELSSKERQAGPGIDRTLRLGGVMED